VPAFGQDVPTRLSNGAKEWSRATPELKQHYTAVAVETEHLRPSFECGLTEEQTGLVIRQQVEKIESAVSIRVCHTPLHECVSETGSASAGEYASVIII